MAQSGMAESSSPGAAPQLNCQLKLHIAVYQLIAKIFSKNL